MGSGRKRRVSSFEPWVTGLDGGATYSNEKTEGQKVLHSDIKHDKLGKQTDTGLELREVRSVLYTWRLLTCSFNLKPMN